MERERKPAGPEGLLAHFMPPKALRAAHEMALKFEREEYVRAYLARRGGLIVLAGIAAMAGGALLPGLLVKLLLPQVPAALPWARTAVLAVAALAWLGLVMAAMFALLRRLEAAALRARAASEMPEAEDGGGHA